MGVDFVSTCSFELPNTTVVVFTVSTYSTEQSLFVFCWELLCSALFCSYFYVVLLLSLKIFDLSICAAHAQTVTDIIVCSRSAAITTVDTGLGLLTCSGQ